MKIVERNRKGLLVELVLPSDIPALNTTHEVTDDLDIERLDFYKDKRLKDAILERENYRCFYIGRKISSDDCYLDHVEPQSKGGSNSYKNIVATCYDANSMKNASSADDFTRRIYRDGLISLSELQSLLEKLDNLRKGELIPNADLVRSLLK